MKLLTSKTEYTETIHLANQLGGTYETPVLFHCYWNGELNEKHYYSILSCYYFNAYKRPHKIILWLENNTPNRYNQLIEQYAEIRSFSLEEQLKNTFITNPFYYNKQLSFYSDVVRYVLLYDYGGVWFDLDCFFLRTLDPLFCHFEKEICVYQWENQFYPNGAVFISLEPKSEKMKQLIEFILKRNRGWGFQEAQLTYDLPLDLLVLPCSWFDAGWIENPENVVFADFFKSTDRLVDFTFMKGSFCFHWHNQWNKLIEDSSIMIQLVKHIKRSI
jgi:hypothetical protein